MGAVTAAVIGAGTALYTTNRARSAQRDQQNFAREQMEGLDPFAEYRPEYAERLRALTADPSSIKAVSYTHLDVYKRQIYRSRFIRDWHF